jgi:hypothetical protein
MFACLKTRRQVGVAQHNITRRENQELYRHVTFLTPDNDPTGDYDDEPVAIGFAF